MHRFGRSSKAKLAETNFQLQRVLNEAIKHVNFSIIEAKRGERRQTRLFREGRSKAQYTLSPHNWELNGGSMAVDIVPYPIPPWNSHSEEDKEETKRRFEEVLFVIKIVASTIGIKLTFGKDFSFKDYPHIELTGWELNRNKKLID